jgi:HlyD family secretion protein
MDRQNDDAARADLRELLAGGGGAGWHLPSRGWLIAAGLLILAVLAYALLRGNGSSNLPQYRTEQAVMGNLVVKVSATGNLKPTNQVDVGSELSGIVESVYVDDNDRVTKGRNWRSWISPSWRTPRHAPGPIWRPPRPRCNRPGLRRPRQKPP